MIEAPANPQPKPKPKPHTESTTIMACSVSTPRNAYEIVYLNQPYDVETAAYYGAAAFDDFIEDLQQVLDGSAGAPGGKGFPSLEPCDEWLDREDHAILENSHAYVTVSEYNGLVAVCLVPKEESTFNYDQSRVALAEAWTRKACDGFIRLLYKAYSGCALISQGRFSNGEQCFTLAGEPGSCVTSKEGRLW